MILRPILNEDDGLGGLRQDTRENSSCHLEIHELLRSNLWVEI
jgi:hypothetical protein